MILTMEEQEWLEGKEGAGVQTAMEVLVKVGDAFGARRLIPVSSAHILGHFGSLHQAGIDFIERLANGEARCRVPTTVDPSSVGFHRTERFRIPEEYREKQERLAAALEILGVIPSWSCTPYLAFNVPRFGQSIAWAESSAVAYANSVIGARTNRTPFGLDVCAAVTGKIPEFGLYLQENRRGSILFEVSADDLGDFDYHTLGAIVGRRSGSRIPVIRGIPLSVTNDQLKMFSSGAASAGSVALYHIPGVTPEATMADPFNGQEPEEVVALTRHDLTVMVRQITTAFEGMKVDMVTLGCPLLSLEELKVVFRKMEGRRVKTDVHFWVYLTEETYTQGERIGLIKPLEDAGIWFSTNTCATISPVKVWKFAHVMTNSAKCALVIPSEHGVVVTYGDMDRCIGAATEETVMGKERE
jgi:predicted aconitase